MKKTIYSLLSISLVYISFALKWEQTTSSTKFVKTVFVEIDRRIDSSLFLPDSKAWKDSWNITNQDVFLQGSNLMHAESYQTAFNNRTENLFTLLHPKLINGEITLYSPFDPLLYGLSGYDDGELRYPIKGASSNENFINSEELRNNMFFYFGFLGPQSDVPLTDEYGDPVILTLADGAQEFVYPPRDFHWYKDTDIIKYKIRISEIVKKNGDVKKRIIESIAPVVHTYLDDQISGEQELFWVDFKEVKQILKDGYFFNKDNKPVTYLKYIEEKVNGK